MDLHNYLDVLLTISRTNTRLLVRSSTQRMSASRISFTHSSCFSRQFEIPAHFSGARCISLQIQPISKKKGTVYTGLWKYFIRKEGPTNSVDSIKSEVSEMCGEINTIKDPVKLKGKESCYFPIRYIVGASCFIGLAWSQAIKILLSVAIVAMVKSEPTHSNNSNDLSDIAMNEDICPGGESGFVSKSQDGEFEWDEQMQGYLLSAFGYGHLATQLLGGRLSEIFGPKIIFGPGLCIAGLLTAISPVIVRIHVGLFIAARVLVGAGSGVMLSAMNCILTKWFVPEERTFIAAIMLTGVPAGKIISMILSGTLAEAGGWQLIFYFFGAIGVAFIVPWIFLFFNTPIEHPIISETEKQFILKGINTELNKQQRGYHKVPWLAILLSGPMWVHIIMGMGFSWMQYTLATQLPKYLNRVLHFNLQNSGIFAALPFLSDLVTGIGGSYLAQWLRLKGYLSRLAAYRIFNSLSGFGSGIFVLLVTFLDCNSSATVVLLVFSMGFCSLYRGGSIINHIDLGRNFSGTLAGMFYTFFTGMGIIVPTVAGFIIDEKQTITQWNTVFYLAASIPSACAVLYLLFGSVEEQPWNKVPETT